MSVQWRTHHLNSKPRATKIVFIHLFHHVSTKQQYSPAEPASPCAFNSTFFNKQMHVRVCSHVSYSTKNFKRTIYEKYFIHVLWRNQRDKNLRVFIVGRNRVFYSIKHTRNPQEHSVAAFLMHYHYSYVYIMLLKATQKTKSFVLGCELHFNRFALCFGPLRTFLWWTEQVPKGLQTAWSVRRREQYRISLKAK